MLVYRVEHKDKRTGPWNSAEHGTIPWDGSVHQMLNQHCTGNSFPGMFADFPSTASYSEMYEYYCALPAKKEVLHWFGPMLRRLHSEGFVLRVYEVPASDTAVGRSGKQVFFKRTNEKLVVEIQLTTLLADNKGEAA